MEETKEGLDEAARGKRIRRMTMKSNAKHTEKAEKRAKAERMRAYRMGEAVPDMVDVNATFVEEVVPDERQSIERNSINERNSLNMSATHDSKSTNFSLPEYVDAFGVDTGYHPFNLRYTKYLPFKDDADKVARGYIKHGRTCLVEFDDEFDDTPPQPGVIIRHFSEFILDDFKHKVHQMDLDTCDMVLEDGTKLKHISVKQLIPIQIITIPLTFGFSLEDFCLILTCLCCVWTFFGVVMGLLLYAVADTTEENTALIMTFFCSILFTAVLVIWTNVSKIVAELRKDDLLIEDEGASTPLVEDIDVVVMNGTN